MTGLRLSTRIEALESASFDAGELYERACESKDLNVYSQYKRKFRQACMLLFSVSRDVEQLEAKAARYDARERPTIKPIPVPDDYDVDAMGEWVECKDCGVVHFCED